MKTPSRADRKLNIAESVVEYVKGMSEEKQNILLKELFEEELVGSGERVFNLNIISVFQYIAE